MEGGVELTGARVRPLPGGSSRITGWPFFLLGALAAAAALAGGPRLAGLAGLAILVAGILLCPMLGVAGLLISAPLSLPLSPYIPKGLPFSFLLLALTVLALALRRVHDPRERPFRWSPLDVAVAFLLLNGLLYIRSGGSWMAGIYGYHETLRLFLIYVVVRLLAPGRSSVTALLWATGLIFFVVLAYGVIQPFHGYETVMLRYGIAESLRDYAGFQRAGVSRAYSIVSSPLTLGMMAMTGILGGVALWTGARRPDAPGWAGLALLAVGIGSAVLSYTRSAWLGILAGLGVAVLFLARGRLRLLLVLAPPLVAAAALHRFPDLAAGVGRYALTILSNDPAETSFHYVALVEAARFFWAHRLGVGLGASSFAGMRFGEGVQMWTENTYLLVGVQTGFQGLLALLVFLVAAIRTGWFLYRRPGAPSADRRLGAAVILGLAGFSVAGLSHPTLLDVTSMAPLWVMVALAANRREALGGTAGGQDGAAGGRSDGPGAGAP